MRPSRPWSARPCGAPASTSHPDATVQERQPDPYRDHHETVAVADLACPLGRAVVLPERPEHPAPGALEQGVIHGHLDRIVHTEQYRDDQGDQRQPDMLHRPDPAGEERMGPVVRPDPLKPRPDQHSADGAPARPGDQTGHHRGEGGEGRRGEALPSQGGAHASSSPPPPRHAALCPPDSITAVQRPTQRRQLTPSPALWPAWTGLCWPARD